MAVCIECKNELDQAVVENASQGDVIECQACGITLEVTKKDDEGVAFEIADEGK